MNNWEGKKILVAEDEDMNFLLIKESLKKSKVKLYRARSGKEAIEVFKNNLDIDLILMDIKMPVMNGYEATKIIKKIKDIPIIAQTAYAMTGEKRESETAGCNAYLTKPIKIKELILLIDKYFSKK